MTIARILAAKGADVFTTTPQRTLKEIAAELIDRRVGALAVLDSSGEIVGLVAERDIVAALANHGAAALGDEVSRHMAKNFKVATEHDSVVSTMDTMTVNRRRHLPVLRQGRLVGLVSIGDVVKYHIDTMEAERLAMQQYIATSY
ncbi:CBS domain-containing protein [Methylocystis sp.]|jgi:CBS domain-containing protein|uniref:CBS domain-containing protein n=1 Tax=Methylocystis sp. TaxID=1911079 RepID=UPI0025DB1C28|nr:CBS domain-containing protein [Methylocystis sp.]